MRRALASLVSIAFIGLAASSTQASSTAIPAVDARCASDADCGTTQVALTGSDQCCYACLTSTAGNKAWLAKLDAACAQILASEHRTCAGLRCASGPTRASCDHGTCKLVTH